APRELPSQGRNERLMREPVEPAAGADCARTGHGGSQPMIQHGLGGAGERRRYAPETLMLVMHDFHVVVVDPEGSKGAAGGYGHGGIGEEHPAERQGGSQRRKRVARLRPRPGPDR